MRFGAVARGPLTRPGREARPRNRGLPLAYRYGHEVPPDPASQGALARDARLAQVEAALFAADEPLTLRRLAGAAGLGDVAEARRLVRFRAKQAVLDRAERWLSEREGVSAKGSA